MRGEQSNSSINFGGRLIMKLFRKIEPGRNPDLELGRFLTEEVGFTHTPPVAGYIEYLRGKDEPLTLAIVQGYVQNEGDAFDYALDVVRRYYDTVLTRSDLAPPALKGSVAELLAAADQPPPPLAEELIGGYLEAARLLGQRTAEMHQALAKGSGPAMAPEPFSTLYQRSIYQSIRSLIGRTLQDLRKQLPSLPAAVRPAAERVAQSEEALLGRLQRITGDKIETVRIRIHGDYHLEQVLFTGKDYVIIDFEGEPLRPISERRIKRSPLRDVAGMLRSYQYAAYAALFARDGVAGNAEEFERLQRWADFWSFWVCASFLHGYLTTAGSEPFVPADRADLEALLETFVVEKAVYELAYEMNNRPDWLPIPINGILRQIEQ
uniref:putative maltokinase n=1 Tax=Chloroflexus sp. TaxID=1904827 RepID=UPI002ACF08EF